MAELELELELELEPPPHAASANNAVTKTALKKCLGIELSPLFCIKQQPGHYYDCVFSMMSNVCSKALTIINKIF